MIQNPMSITGQTLADCFIEKIEQDYENIIIHLSEKPNVDVTIKCKDYIGYELIGKWDDFIVLDISINNCRDLVDKSIDKVNNLYEDPDSKYYNYKTSFEWQQINIKLIDGVEIKVACKNIEVYY